MPTTKLTMKCQTTVPRPVREQIGVGPGSEIEWLQLPDGRYTIQARTQSVKRLKGAVEWHGPTVTIEQMNADIADAVAQANQ